MIRVDSDKLKEVMRRRGFTSFEEVAAAAERQGLELGMVTIYNIANNQNWTRKKMEALCRVLGCDPRDFIYFENGNSHTHALPQPAKRRRKQIEAECN